MQVPKTTSYISRIFYIEGNQLWPDIELRNYTVTIYLFSRRGYIPLWELPILNLSHFDKYMKQMNENGHNEPYHPYILINYALG